MSSPNNAEPFINSKNNIDRKNAFFSTEHLDKSLKKKLVSGLAVTVSSQGFKFVLQMMSTVVLARLLTPSDYGIIGMAIVVIRFAQMFGDMGLSSATVQAESLNHKQVSTLFWINLSISLGLALLVALASPLIAGFYGEPRLRWITMALSVTFVLSGLSIQHQAILKRQMRFFTLASIEIFAMVLGIAGAVLAALNGGGYWSLVVLYTVMPFVGVVGAWIACKWRPGLPRKGSGVRKLFFFGSNLTGFNLLNFFARNLDNILIGRFLGAGALGIYDRAYQLLLLPIQQINGPVQSAALPTLCRLQRQPEKYKRYYYNLIFLVTSLGMPLVSFMFVDAREIILLVLGQEWIDAVEIFRYLAPAAIVGTFNFAEGWAYQSLGRTDRQFRIGIVLSSIIVLIFLISVQGGIKSVAIAYGIGLPILRIPSLLYCYHKTPLSFTSLLKTLALPFTAAAAAGLILFSLKLNWLSSHFGMYASYGLFVDLFAFAFCYVLLWLSFPKGRENLKAAFNDFVKSRRTR